MISWVCGPCSCWGPPFSSSTRLFSLHLSFSATIGSLVVTAESTSLLESPCLLVDSFKGLAFLAQDPHWRVELFPVQHQTHPICLSLRLRAATSSLETLPPCLTPSIPPHNTWRHRIPWRAQVLKYSSITPLPQHHCSKKRQCSKFLSFNIHVC